MQAEVLFEIYRAQLATGGVKRNRLPKSLHIPRPKPHETRRAPERRRATNPTEILAAIKAGFR